MVQSKMLVGRIASCKTGRTLRRKPKRSAVRENSPEIETMVSLSYNYNLKEIIMNINPDSFFDADTMFFEEYCIAQERDAELEENFQRQLKEMNGDEE